MSQKTLVLIFFLLSHHLYAQKEDYQWIVGYNFMQPIHPIQGHSMFDFNYDPVRIAADTVHTIDMGGGNATLCDSTGQLRYTSNGQVIYDGQHQLVEDTINYDKTIARQCNEWEYNNSGNATQAIPNGLLGSQRIIILPLDNNQYSFIYNTHNYCKEFRYQILETRINSKNNKDQVVFRDKLLLRDTLRAQVYAIRHGNGRDWWVINFSYKSEYLHVLLVTPEGTTAVHKHLLPTNNGGLVGHVVASPDGSKLAFYMGAEFLVPEGGGFGIADFDRCSGEISNVQFRYWPALNIGSGVAFSSDGHYLYVCETYTLTQYDMWSSDIIGSEEVVAEYDGFIYDEIGPNWLIKVDFGALKLGPDGRIYIFPTAASQRYMSVIEHPTRAGLACDVKQHLIYMPKIFTRTQPNIADFRLGPLDGSPCDTLGIDNHPVAKYRYEPDTLDALKIHFSDLSYFRPETWSWDFGDGSPVGRDRHTDHSYAQKGTYEVCLTVSNENSSHTYCRTIAIGTSSVDVSSSYPVDVHLFPVPVEDDLLVTLGEYIPTNGSISLYDMMGVQVHVQRIYYGHNTLSLSHLRPGSYIWIVRDEGKVIRQGKVVKMGG